jgi:hypothetical protein
MKINSSMNTFAASRNMSDNVALKAKDNKEYIAVTKSGKVKTYGRFSVFLHPKQSLRAKNLFKREGVTYKKQFFHRVKNGPLAHEKLNYIIKMEKLVPELMKNKVNPMNNNNKFHSLK